jgi:hypothetical protein
VNSSCKNRVDDKAATRKRTPHTSAARGIGTMAKQLQGKGRPTHQLQELLGRRQSSYKEKDAPHNSCKSYRDDDKAATRKRTPHTSAARRGTTIHHCTRMKKATHTAQRKRERQKAMTEQPVDGKKTSRQIANLLCVIPPPPPPPTSHCC